MSRSRRVFLVVNVAGAIGLAGCSDGDDEEPGLHAIDVFTLYRDGDSWYDYPEEVGVQVTVENTDVDRHRETLAVTLQQVNDSGTWIQRRVVELPGGTTRGYRFRFTVNESGNGSFTADASIER